MLSLYKLEIFNSVTMEGSFSKAARQLSLTQPAVSQHIRDLEASLGVQVFVRGNRGVQLTPAGEVLLDYTRCIMCLLADAESAVMSVSQKIDGTLSIGATPGASVYLMPGWIQAFYLRFPGATVALKTDITPAIAAELLAGRLDIGFVEGELSAEPPLRTLSLRSIHLYVVVGPLHPWWSRSSVRVTDLHQQAFIARPAGSQTRTWTDQLFIRHGVTPRVVAEFDHPETIKQAVASGMGITLLPDWGIADAPGGRVRALPIEDAELQRVLKLVWNEAHVLKPTARAFLSSLLEQFPQLAPFAAPRLAMPGSAQPIVDLEIRTAGAYPASLCCHDEAGLLTTTGEGPQKGENQDV